MLAKHPPNYKNVVAPTRPLVVAGVINNEGAQGRFESAGEFDSTGVNWLYFSVVTHHSC